jgi:hypothetical protein
MSFEAITDHQARALARLMLQFRNSVEIASILTALASRVQEIENAIVSVIAQYRSPATATADLLDRLSRLVQVPPATFEAADGDQQRLTQATISANKSTGTAPELASIVFQGLGGAWAMPEVIENGETSALWAFRGGPDCAMICEKTGPVRLKPLDYRVISELVSEAAPAGMRAIFVFVPDNGVATSPLYCDGFGGSQIDNPNFVPVCAVDKPL